MKGNVKKIFAAVLALALVLSVAGCGGNKTGLDADGNYEVVWYNSEPPRPDHNLVYEEISKYTKEKIGVTVKYTPFAGAEYAEKMNLLFASGEKIDMCYASTNNKFQQNARQSAYMDMGPLLDGVGKQTKDLFPQYALDCYKVGGVQYGIPVLKDWAFQPVVGIQNKKLDELGIREEYLAAKTLADFTPIIEKAKAAHPDWYGFVMRGNYNLMKFLPQETIDGSVVAGFTFDNYDKVINIYETDAFKELATLMRSWYNAGYIPSNADTSTSSSDIYKLGNYLAGHAEYLPYINDSKPDGDPDKDVYNFNLCTPRMGTTQVTMCGLAMPATCLNPERTMEFINLVYNDVYVRNTIAYGIEGKHWVADGDNKWKLPEGFENKVDTGYSSSISDTGNRYILRTDPGIPEDIWEKYQEFDANAIKSGAIGFSFDPQPVQGQIAAVNNVWNEFFKAIVVGAVDPEVKLPEFIAAMNKVGAQEIIAEAQRQYDEWKKNK